MELRQFLFELSEWPDHDWGATVLDVANLEVPNLLAIIDIVRDRVKQLFQGQTAFELGVLN